MSVSYYYVDPDLGRQQALDEIRARMRASVGLGPNGTGEGLEHGARLLYPRDTIADAISMFRAHSTCGLRVLREYEDAGLDDPRLLRPYKGRTDAISLVHQIPRKLGLWFGLPMPKRIGATPNARRPDAPWPLPGYVVLLGGRSGQQEHALTVVDEEPDGVVLSVDGGQPDRDGDDQDTLPDGCIQFVRRRFVRHAPGDLRSYTTNGAPGRHVLGLWDLAGYVARRRAGEGV